MRTTVATNKTPMAQPMRAIMKTINGLMKLNLMPNIESMLAKSHDERHATTIPGFTFRKTNPAIITEDVYVEARDGYKIHTRVYKRPGTPEGAPGYLFIHGGGFVDGGVAHCDHVCRELADRSGFVVVGLSYRLAPDYPFPAGIQDCQDVLTYMAKERPFGLDPERLAVGGESAGGNFTTSLAIWARDNNGPRIAHHAPIYPLTDFSMSNIDWSEGNLGNPGVTPAAGDAMVEKYLLGADPKDPAYSVLYANHADLPPALVVTCGYDVLREEGIALAESYLEAGVPTRHAHFADMPHGYLLMTRLSKRPYETMDLMISEANKYF